MGQGRRDRDLISDERWSRLFAEHPDALERPADEALAEHGQGTTVPLDPEGAAAWWLRAAAAGAAARGRARRQ